LSVKDRQAGSAEIDRLVFKDRQPGLIGTELIWYGHTGRIGRHRQAGLSRIGRLIFKDIQAGLTGIDRLSLEIDRQGRIGRDRIDLVRTCRQN
jgi:hypothetical protein